MFPLLRRLNCPPQAMPINKVTITPRGHTLGRLDMMQEREHDTTKGSLLASLDVAMGGRVGEEIALGEFYVFLSL